MTDLLSYTGNTPIIKIGNIFYPDKADIVEIGGFARISGRVSIGNNVKIAPHSIIKVDVPDDSLVIMESNKQKIVLRG